LELTTLEFFSSGELDT